ncbi:tRNA threonylcarbamoyladenosine biosynthesis protein TsaB [Natranaerovirga hydrolytica]|uniref:tRNA threonylcarbamoyladenosine biosynthesis protein TsaB n=1 Tax=Natranaerovirga hydrolytica TaxID=680378 RepID=A0A4R1M993_9FIRM|nr:tRNA (adenosine(37)-N6)-threonylcarbamoyltransferase complex dimerization subunit type 1 TsaB [Natranaerovirga hydrolytica]TCK87940.1 tRNA threonylcarbamoyladenosine biosynthesis protein TsaB [Natranaerovirga hydrolytica]
MKILAIESSGLTASVAVMTTEDLIGEYTLNCKKTHSQTLMPLIEQLNKDIDLTLKDIDAIAISEGPGSFTGLRIGAATAKGLAFSLNIPILSVSSIDGLANNILCEHSIICPIMDAKRNQIYTALYKREKGQLNKITDSKVIDIETLIEELKTYDQQVTFNGDGVEVYKEIIEQSSLLSVFAPKNLMKQKASSIGDLALSDYGLVKKVKANDFVPVYLRKSQAEREYEQRIKNND